MKILVKKNDMKRYYARKLGGELDCMVQSGVGGYYFKEDVDVELAKMKAEIAELKRKNDQLWNYADRLYRFYVKNMESLLEGADAPLESWKHKGELYVYKQNFISGGFYRCLVFNYSHRIIVQRQAA